MNRENDGLDDLEARLSVLTLGTLAIPNIRTIRPIDVPAKAASDLVDFLPMVSTGFTRIPNHNLAVRINKAHFCSAFWDADGKEGIIS
jgi:hypothetical protein